MTDHPPVRPFADFIREHGQGRTHDELSEAIRDLLARVNDTGRKGSVSLKITIEPMKKGGDGMVVVSDAISLSLPEFDRPTGVWFTDKHGNLTRNDPNQLAFDSLREVPPPPGVDASGEITDPKTYDREAN